MEVNMKTAKDYYSTHMVKYDEPTCTGSLSIKVLEFLKGKPWNDVALGFVHSLRPTSIRVTDGTIKLDARPWRVTVTVDEKDIIQEITQEVVVGLPDKVAHGSALRDALKYGTDSPECQWHNDDNIECIIMGMGRYAKQLSDGTIVPFPGTEK
jgi:hypothetical protein